MYDYFALRLEEGRLDGATRKIVLDAPLFHDIQEQRNFELTADGRAVEKFEMPALGQIAMLAVIFLNPSEWCLSTDSGHHGVNDLWFFATDNVNVDG